MSDATRILEDIEHGDLTAAARLLPVVYDELRRLAAQKLRHESPGQTLQATALVHEAYIRLVDVGRAQHWQSRRHFFAAAAESMRRILIERARRRRAARHGGGWKRAELSGNDLLTRCSPDQLLVFNDTLTELGRKEPDAAELVKMRVFAGFSVQEAAEALGISRATAYRSWTYARAWLLAEMQNDE